MSRLSLFVDREDGLGAGLNLHDPNSPLARYFFSIGSMISAAILAAVYIVLNYVPLNHTDIWAHLRFGDQVINSRNLLTGDTLSQFATGEGVATNYCWLSQTVLAGVFRIGAWLESPRQNNPLESGDLLRQTAGGCDTLRFFLAVVVCTRLVLLLVAFRRLARSRIIAAMGLAFVVVVGVGSLGVLRPQVFGELLFAAMLVPLSRERLSIRGTILIPLLMVVWANSHGSYPIGLAILGVVWLSRLMQVSAGPAPRISGVTSDESLRRLTVAILLSLAAITVLNPDGFRIFQSTLSMANHPNVTAMDEWLPLTSANTTGARIAFGLCAAFVVFSVAVGRDPRRWQTWLAMLVFSGNALLHQRGVIWLFMVAPWVAMPHWGDAFARLRPDWCFSVPSFKKTLIVGMIVFIAIMWSLPLQRLSGGKLPELARSVSDGTPWQQAFALSGTPGVSGTPLAKAIHATFPEGKFAGTIYAGDTLGDFFIWHLPSPAPVYMYSHVQMFSAQHWQKYTMIRDTRDGWREEMDRAKINLVVVRPAVEPNICQKLRTDSAWTVVTDEANLTNKRDPRNRLFVALRKVPLLVTTPQ